MKIGVALSQTLVIYVEVDELGTVEEIKVLLEVETNIIVSQQRLIHNNSELRDNTPILESGILEGDIIQLIAPLNPYKLEALDLLQRYRENPAEFLNYGRIDPNLLEMFKNGDLISIEKFIQQLTENKNKMRMDKVQNEMKLDLDPLNPDAQKEIESRINQKNIDENLKYAQEYVPEMFAKVTMLYIDIKVHGKAMQAFVDSGAQSTILSKKCAEKLGIMRLADIRFSGQVVGVGTDNIVGRIHAINLEIGGNFYDCSIYVIENAKIDMLFGLDMLKRHQCCIDLHKNVLTLNAGQFSVPFLSDAQIHRDGDEEFMDVDKVKNQNVEEKKVEEKKVEEKKVEEKKVEVKKVEEKKVEEKKTEAPSLNAGNIARPTPASNSHPWEEKIMKIVKLGYSRDDALRALTSFNGNEDMAASYLFSRGSGFGFD